MRQIYLEDSCVTALLFVLSQELGETSGIELFQRGAELRTCWNLIKFNLVTNCFLTLRCHTFRHSLVGRSGLHVTGAFPLSLLRFGLILAGAFLHSPLFFN